MSISQPQPSFAGSSPDQVPAAHPREKTAPKWRMWLAACVVILAVDALLGARAFETRQTRLERAARAFNAEALGAAPAPALRLPVRGGGTVELGPLRGKVVLVNFWATWCPPCRAEEPALDRLSRIFDPATFQIIAASADDEWAPIQSYFGPRTPGYVVALDQDASVRDRWGTNQFPETWLVDPGGALRFKVVGGRDWTSPEALELLERAGARRR